MFEFIPVVMKNFFRKPATRDYPRVVRAPFDKQKGHIVINLPDCIYCGMCSRKCPVGAIEVKRQDKSWAIDRFKCIACNACVEVCPKKCLAMGPERSPAASRKSLDLFKMPPVAVTPVVAGGKEEKPGA